MAAREKKTLRGTAERFVAKATHVEQRRSRTRDLILGLFLAIAGLVVLTLYVVYMLDVIDTTPSGGRFRFGGWFVYSIPIMVVAAGAVIVGVQQTIRGIRG